MDSSIINCIRVEWPRSASINSWKTYPSGVTQGRKFASYERAHVRAAPADLPHGFQIQYLPRFSPFLNITMSECFCLWKQALNTRLAEVRHDLLEQPSTSEFNTGTACRTREYCRISRQDGSSFQGYASIHASLF